MIWIYTIKSRIEALEVFKKFKVLIEKDGEKATKILRADGGGKYASIDFEAFYVSVGITHKVTSHYTPQRNGLA